MTLVKSGFETWNFRAKPVRQIAVRMHGDADVTLLNDGMDIDRSESFGADADMHLHSGGGIWGPGRWRRHRRGGGRGVNDLVGLG